MKKQLGKLALSFGLLCTFSGQAQHVQPCETNAAMEEHFKADPSARKMYESVQEIMRAQYEEFRNSNPQSLTTAFEYTIPVVFHILHTYGPENVSDALCKQALAQVNSDLAKMGSDASLVSPVFGARYINSDIKLMLAHKDPQGNCTNGIVHRYDERTIWDRSGNLTTLYQGIPWNPTRYLNIIIVRDIVAQSGQNGIVIGYTYKPGSWGSGANPDCIVYNYQYLNGLAARSLTHELGHWLGLSHTFGDTNNPGVSCGDDGLYDTPPTKGDFSTCPPSTSGNACATTGNTVYSAGMQNTENFMNYGSCARNFTSDQTFVMRSSLASSTSMRNNLWSNANLAMTDVNGLGNCAPIADFYPVQKSFTVCQGGSLNMKDYSYNALPSAWSWDADLDAVIAAPVGTITQITFPTVGVCNVSLTVQNGFGSNTIVRKVTVIDPSAMIVGRHMESFEGGLPDGWQVINNEPGTVQWEHTFDAGFDGAACFYLDGSKSNGGDIDILQTPIIDVASNPNAEFEFGIAYAQYMTGFNDQLKIQASKDCGGTWVDVRTISATTMQTNSGGVSATSFTPTMPEQWKVFTLKSFPPWYGFTNSSNVILRFTFIEHTIGHGNNIYIDAVNLFGDVTGVNELAKKMHYAVLPNPAGGEATVRFTLNEGSDVSLTVKDVIGRDVIPARSAFMESGENEMRINEGATLPTGIYFVNLRVNGTQLTKKLIIE